MVSESKFIRTKGVWKTIGLDHTSPSQFNNPLDIWVAKYIMLSPQERKAIPASMSMEFGGFVGQAVQLMKTKNLTLKQVMDG